MTNLEPLPGIRRADKWNKRGSGTEVIISSRCRVCKSGDLRNLVNKMLVSGMGYAEVHKQIQPLCKSLGLVISYDTIRNHQQAHLPVEAAAIRTIVNKRVDEVQQDFVDGTRTVVTAAEYAESMMTKGFFNLASEETSVTPMEGLAAAQVFHKIVRESESEASVSSLLFQLDRIIEAVKAVVPAVYWEKISTYLKEQEVPGLAGARVIEVDSLDEELASLDDEPPFDPPTDRDNERDEW